MNAVDPQTIPLGPMSQVIENIQKPIVVDFEKRLSLTPEQIQHLIAANQSFIRNISTRLSSSLDVDVRVAIVAAERTLYHDHLEKTKISKMYFGEALFTSSAASLVCLDLCIVDAVVHLGLGGLPDTPASATRRELTDIDAAVMDLLLGTFWVEINQVWSSCNLRAEYKSVVPSAKLGKIFAPSEYLLVFTYEIKIGKVEGTLQVALSTPIADTLLRELDRRDTRHAHSPEIRRLLQTRLASTTHNANLRLPSFRLNVSQILALKPDTLLACGMPQSTYARFGVVGGKMWNARPARRDGRLVAQIEHVVNDLQS